MRAATGLLASVGLVAGFFLAPSVASAQPPGQALPEGIRGGSEIVPEDGVEIRTYLFEDTGEQLPYSVFVSSKVEPDKPAPLILALRGFTGTTLTIVRGTAVDLAEAGGNSAEFVGIWRGTCPAIIRIQMDASGDGEWGIDNIEYGVGSGCEADCNGDGTLNILDFVCFQGLFTSGNLEADCTGDGALNILDFVCFQSAFQAGCS
jgi:hypothetical protein